MNTYYVIEDGYQWIACVRTPAEFRLVLDSHIAVMSRSTKENTYFIRNVFMTEKEFEETQEVLFKAKLKKAEKAKPTLRLVN